MKISPDPPLSAQPPLPRPIMSHLSHALTPLRTSAPSRDLATRAFHWTLLLGILFNGFLQYDRGHEWVGYTACALALLSIAATLLHRQYTRLLAFFPAPDRLHRHLHASARSSAPSRSLS